MTVDLSIKNAPSAVVKCLKARAARNHRSLQGELLTILESVAQQETLMDAVTVASEVKRMGLRNPAESVAMVREDRDVH